MANPEGYALTETLREDGETTLCRARKTSDASEVLLLSSKRAAPTLIARLEREYSLRSELDPRWSAKPLALLRHDSTVTLVLEDSGGIPLNVAAFGPHRVAERLDVAIGLALALNQVHERGLIHKDIKPANVLMNPATGEVHLMGFGIATHLPRERPAPEPPEAIAGTLAYMAPEQTGRMNRSIDSRSDLYSLGITLYELFTGAQPFTASEPMAWIHCHVARLPVPPAERNRSVPGQLSAVIMKLLAKTPEDRYQTALGLEADLRRCLAEWQTSGQIAPFALAERDTSTRLLIPEKLYGREQETAALLAAWERVVSSGAPELLLVSGYSGVGKSSLVNELHKSIVLPRGRFASGKFDQYRRGIPCATLAQAFAALIQQVLVEPEETVARYRATIQQAVGPNGQLIVDLVPELEFVIGKQEAVPVLPAQESQNRCHAVFTRFLGVFARPEHPLALFLDDLQWLDPASLNLLQHILSSSEVRDLLLIGAYRDNEVSPSHPLMLTLDSVRCSTLPVHDIVLAPLSADDIAELVGDTVHRGREEVRPLARLVYEKTAGNPFFTTQFLTALHDEALLRLIGERWEWDLERIRATDFTDNVVELMIGKLGRLSAATQGALKVLACLGHRVDSAVLGRVLGQGAEETQAALWDAIVAGLIVMAGNGYAFAHDRIQEAAYSLIPEPERATEHLRVGRLLLLGRPEPEIEEAIFELVNHFNRGLELVTDAAEKELIFDLNFRAGKRAKAANAYASARTYLAQAMALLPQEAWSRQYAETFELIFDASECEYLVGNFARADDLLNLILARARSHPDRAKVYRLRATLFQVAGRYQDALRAGLEGLEPFGIVAPESAGALQAAFSRELEEFSLNLRGRRIADLVDAKVASDADARAVIGLVAEISVPLYSTRSPLFPWLILRSVNTSLRFGNTEDSCLGYIFLAILRIGLFDDIPTGFELSEMALRLNEKFHNEKLRGTLLFIHGLVVHSWRRPFATSLPIAEQGLVASLNVGDLVHANLNAYALVWQT
ncbi:MAG TPA: serine/threonine-protein kinase PknK, partial [Polyangiaceae bacterium]|nr:serine/threonine-protein kinase PknK [Polyangiaceae bacterium]